MDISSVLQKYQSIDERVRNIVSGDLISSATQAISAKYSVNASLLLMAILTQSLKILEIDQFLIKEHSLTAEKARDCVNEIIDQVILPLKKQIEITNKKPVESVSQINLVDNKNITQAIVEKPTQYSDADALKKADAVIEKIKITFSSAIFHDRLRTALKTYFLGVRDESSLRDVLSAPVNNGGIGLGGGDIGSIMDETRAIKKQGESAKNEIFSKSGVDKISSPVHSGERDIDYDFNAIQKPYDDYQRKTQSPEEELRRLTLKDFRLLGADPIKTAEYVKNKIAVIAKHGEDKKANAILAWRQSPLNMVYLKIGQKSIARLQSVDEILAQIQASDQSAMTKAEFDAIGEINKELKPR